MNVKQEGSKNSKAYNPITSFRVPHSLNKLIEEEAYVSKKTKSYVITERLLKSYRDDKPKQPKVDRSAFYDCTVAEFVYECAVICYGKDLVKLKKSRTEQEKFISVIGPVVFKCLGFGGDLHPVLDTVLSPDYVSDAERLESLYQYLVNSASMEYESGIERLKILHSQLGL